jgi:hypothetical protein
MTLKQHKQLGFELLQEKAVKYFGGAYLKNSHAKTKRPLSTKKPSHLVLRSSRAIGSRSFLKFSDRIEALIKRQGRLHGVKIYRFANGGNHLHLIILPISRDAFNRFIRSLSGLIIRIVFGIEKGRGQKLKFWDQRPFTRIIEWGRDYRRTAEYLALNTLEALGFVAHQPRRTRFSTA